MTWQIGDVIHFLVAVWNWFIVATVRSCVSEGYLGWWMRSRNEWEKFSFRPFECANFLATSHFSPSIFHSPFECMRNACVGEQLAFVRLVVVLWIVYGWNVTKRNFQARGDLTFSSPLILPFSENVNIMEHAEIAGPRMFLLCWGPNRIEFHTLASPTFLLT